MTPDFDQLAQRLIAELGTAAISTDAPPLNTYSVDGKRGALICRPASAPEVAATLRLCSEAQAHVTPRGGGTAMTLGNPPRRVDVIIDLQKLNRVLDHDAANLTVTAQSGLKLSVLQDALARHKQFAPFDAPFPDRATIGGTIAANLNGPRRSAYGSVRDLVIGIKVALANGEQIKAGGKVVKNVAGYDLGKLFVGSLGTLGIITETTVRVAPIAECFATVVASGNLPNALALIEAVDRSPLLPAALALVNEPMKSHWRAAIWCEGFEETVARYRRDLTALADQFGATTEVLAGRAHDEFWSRINNLPLMPNRLIVRVTLPRAELAVFVTMIDHHGAITIAGDVAAGTLWLVLEPNQATMQLFAEVQAIAHEHHGHAVLFAAPAVLKQGIEVWGPAPATLSLMREIKRQFDPLGLLNSGRFLGGI